jgi:hypothetical protein
MTTNETSDHRPLLSTTTILILSGFLIGLAVGNQLGAEVSPYLMGGGLAGLLTFIALDLANRQRSEAAVEESQREMERRLDKHLLSVNGTGAKIAADQHSAQKPHRKKLSEAGPPLAVH